MKYKCKQKQKQSYMYRDSFISKLCTWNCDYFWNKYFNACNKIFSLNEMLITDISSEFLQHHQPNESSFSDHSSLNTAPQQIFIAMNL